MKTIFLSFILIVLLAIPAFSQSGINVITVNESPAEIFAGSLHKSFSGDNEKLKIDVFGGNWHSTNVGMTTYYISTRDGNRVNMERHGGDGSNFRFKVYANGDFYDFVIARTEDLYCSFTVQSQRIYNDWGITPIKPVEVKKYDPTGKIDVTNQFPVNVIFAANNNGNVGIGTNNARNKLDVNGTIRAKEIKVEVSNWSDFVFAPDYQLPSLKDVESHIDEHQHLPGIPSEKEVSGEGVDLGRMNALLLQKIEELTLYLIQQEKRISQLESEKYPGNKHNDQPLIK